MYGAERGAPLQESAETVSHALACLTDRLIWPYCLPLMAEMCLELREEIVGAAHEAYIRCAKCNGANLILSGLYDRLARLLEHSLLKERDHIPINCFGNSEIISVQDWLAISGMTQPLAQKWECNGSNVPKETVVNTVRNSLVELRARHDRVHGRRGSAAPPSKPGRTAVVNTAVPHQTFEGGRTYTPLVQQRERSDCEESLVGGAAEIDANTMKDASGAAEEALPAPGYNDDVDDGALPET